MQVIDCMLMLRMYEKKILSHPFFRKNYHKLIEKCQKRKLLILQYYLQIFWANGERYAYGTAKADSSTGKTSTGKTSDTAFKAGSSKITDIKDPKDPSSSIYLKDPSVGLTPSSSILKDPSDITDPSTKHSSNAKP